MSGVSWKKELLVYGYVKETAQSDVSNDVKNIIVTYCKSFNVYSVDGSERNDILSNLVVHPHDFYAGHKVRNHG